jgi:hypothetical protein
VGREDVKRKVCCDREIARACGRWVGDFWTKVVDARRGSRETAFGIRHSAFGIRRSAFVIRHSAFGLTLSGRASRVRPPFAAERRVNVARGGSLWARHSNQVRPGRGGCALIHVSPAPAGPVHFLEALSRG